METTQKDLSVGDTVKYSRIFLRNTGQVTGDVPFARGKIVDLKPFGDRALATVDFDLLGQTKVLTVNLVREDDLESRSW